MTVTEGRGGFERPRPSARAAWSPAGFAYVPGRVLARDEDAADHVDAITRRLTRGENRRRPVGARDDAPDMVWHRIDLAPSRDADDAATPSALDVVSLARADGFEVQPDHVFFAHDCDPCCGAPHPFFTFDAILADPLHGNPLHGNPLHGNPLHGNPLHGNPLHGNPFVIDPLHGNESATSGVRPAADRELPLHQLTGAGAHPRITILDTGLADGTQRPALLSDPKRFGGVADAPSSQLTTQSGAKVAPDAWLDPVAGHGTFIAGLIEQLAPGCTIHVERVIQPLGDAVESDVIAAILKQAALPAGQRPDILSLSFGGAALAQAPALASAVAKAQLAGIVVVASAGNSGSSEPQYPAAYDGVIAVGAIGPDGPAPWTNYGSWVDACAPGVDLVSSFFADFDGPAPEVNTTDPDRFAGWARWSGTSFAVPIVVAALAREMVVGGLKTPKDAVGRVVGAPHALRIRCLGTVVSA